MRTHRPLFLAFALLISACVSEASRPAVIPIVSSEPSPEIDALVARFFSEGPSTPALAGALQASFRQHPTSGALLEVAAYSALLEGDDHAAWTGFLAAASDLHHAGAALDLDELNRLSLTRSEMDTSMDTLAKLEHMHVDPLVRARAAYMRAGYLRLLGRVEEAAEAVAPLQFIRSVEVLGAFDNEEGKGFGEVYPPESQVDLTATVPGAIRPVQWRKAEVRPHGVIVPLADYVYPSQQAVAYAAVWVSVPKDTRAVLRMSTDASVAAWVDHGLVVREEHVKHFGLDNVVADVVLRAGTSEILIKSGVKAGAWDLGIRFTDTEGNPLAGLTTSLVAGNVARVPYPAAVSKSTASPAIGHRDAFASARERVLKGLCQPGLAALEKLLSRSSGNALLRYFTADAATQDHQTERALDLLTAGISANAAWPAFLRARAQIYIQKELWSQAQRDLARAIELQPKSRNARIDLADVDGRRGWQADKMRLLKEVLVRNPDSARALSDLGAAREALGHRGLAAEAYRNALELEPGSYAALRALGRLAEEGGNSSAAKWFGLLDELSPAAVSEQLAHAEFDRAQGRMSEADARLRAVSLQSPNHPTPYLRRAQIADEQGRTAEAILLYQAAQERDPRDASVTERLQSLAPAASDVLRPYTPSDEDIDAALKKPSVRGDSASHIEMLLSEHATLLNTDGSSRQTYTEIARVLSQKGRDELVRVALPTGGLVRVLKAFAQTPSGERQEASSIDKTSVRFRNLEVGSTVVLQYAYYPRRGGALRDEFYDDQKFSRAGWHVDHMRWVVVAPKSKELFFDVDSHVKHETSEVPIASGAPWVVHQFSRDDVSALPWELNMVPVYDLQAHVVVSSMPSWDHFIQWAKAILDESFPADPAIDALAATLTVGATSPRDKLAKLFAFVAQEIRYQQEYESILAGWQPHRSAVVLKRKYGDCKDKSTLLIALARSVGINLEFAMLATHHVGHPARKVVLPFFNHAIAYVPAQPGIDAPFFLDPTVDALDLWNLREDDQGSSALTLNPTTGTWTWQDIPFQTPEYSRKVWRAKVDIEGPDQVHVNSHIELRGSSASAVRTLLRSEDQSRQVYDLLVSGLLPGGKLITGSAPDHESLVHPLVIDEEIDAAGAVRQEGVHYRLVLPNEIDVGPTKLAERQTPLDLGPPSEQDREITVHLGKGVTLMEKPNPVDVKDPCFHARRTIQGTKTEVTVHDEFTQTCTTVAVDAYPRFRAAMDKARGMLDAALVFDKAGPNAKAPK